MPENANPNYETRSLDLEPVVVASFHHVHGPTRPGAYPLGHRLYRLERHMSYHLHPEEASFRRRASGS